MNPGSTVDVTLILWGENLKDMKESGLIHKARLSIMVHVGESTPGVASWKDELDAALVADVAKLGASLALTVMWPLPGDK